MNDLKNGLHKVFSCSVQQQLLIGLFLFIGIAVFSQSLSTWFASAALIWLGLIVASIGLLFGTQLAVLSIIYPLVVLSPWYQQNTISLETLLSWLAQFIALALLAWGAGEVCELIKSGLKTSTSDGKRHDDKRRRQFADADVIAKHLAELLNDQKGSLEKLDLLAVKLNNFDQVKAVAGSQQADSMADKLAESLSASLGQHGHVSRTDIDQLIGFGNSGLSIEVLEQKINEQLEAFANHHPDYLDLKATTNIDQMAAPDENTSAKKYTKRFVQNARAMQQDLEQRSDASGLEQTLTKETIPKARKVLAALTNHDITMHYQPRLNADNGHFTVLEALPHWQHPKFGSLWLDQFAEIITEAKQWPYFAQWMISQVTHDIEQWTKKGFRFHLSLKLPFEHHKCDKLLDHLVMSCPKSFINNERLSIIISSPAYLELEDTSTDKLNSLKQIGAHIIVSEFGDGRLTVKSLREESVDGVKISSKLIEAASHNSDSLRELMTLIKMAKSNGLTTIASDIDSKESLLKLKRYGFDELQGPILCDSVAKKQIPWSRFR